MRARLALAGVLAVLSLGLAAGPALASAPAYPYSGSYKYTEGYGCDDFTCKTSTFLNFHVTWNPYQVWINTPENVVTYGTSDKVVITWKGYVCNGSTRCTFNAGFNATINGKTGYWFRIDVKNAGLGCDVRGNMPGTMANTYCKGVAQ